MITPKPVKTLRWAKPADKPAVAPPYAKAQRQRPMTPTERILDGVRRALENR